MVTASFILASLVVLALSLYAEHRDQKEQDAVIFTVGLMLSLVACLVGERLTKHYWPHDIQPMVAVAAATDVALTAMYVWSAVRSPETWKLILGFIGTAMCCVHVVFLARHDFSRAATDGWWFTANVGFALSLLIIGSRGGRLVCDLLLRLLPSGIGRNRPVGAVKNRREP